MSLNDRFDDVVKRSTDGLRRRGDLIFTVDDIYKTPFFLDKLLRAIFVEKRITKEYFTLMSHRYARDTLGLDIGRRNVETYNLYKTIKKGRITQSKFMRVLKVFEFELSDIEITVNHVQDNKEHFKLSDLLSKNTQNPKGEMNNGRRTPGYWH